MHDRLRSFAGGVEAEAREQCRQDDLRLHHREVRAHADARPRPERQVAVAVAVAPGLGLGREMIRVEGVGGIPEHPVPMQRVDVEKDRLAAPDLAVVELIGRQHVSREESHRRIEAHGLIEHLLDVGHPGKVGVLGRPVTEHGARLGMGALLRLGIVGQQVERPRDRQRRGLVARDDEELHVVQKLLRRHRAPGLGVFCLEHVIEQIVHRPGPAHPARVDGPRHHAVHRLHRRPPEKLGRAWHPRRHLEEIEERRAPHGQEVTGDCLAIDLGIEVLAAR